MLYKFFRMPVLSEQALAKAMQYADVVGAEVEMIESEWCYYVETEKALDEIALAKLRWLLAETFDPNGFREASMLESENIIEVGPRLNFETSWSSAAVTICKNCHIDGVTRLERSRRYRFVGEITSEQTKLFAQQYHDRMTEQVYLEPLTSFETGVVIEPVRVIPLLQQGIVALELVNSELGLAFDEQDKIFILNLFVNVMKRNPTDVELFEIAQANSEHCRHWYFKAKLVIDGVEMPVSLLDLVREPLKRNRGNSAIGFGDDSSALWTPWVTVQMLVAENPGVSCSLVMDNRNMVLTFTAETHNHPSKGGPYPGAATGTGGRIRDNLAVGRGGMMQVGLAAYAVGNLCIPDYEMAWEKDEYIYKPSGAVSPLEILIQASNGASDYGNCIGEPVIGGFVRSFGMDVGEEYYSWLKPIVYVAGAGQMDMQHIKKGKPQSGMLVVKIGGPEFRIGIGGGARSSAQDILTDNFEDWFAKKELDVSKSDKDVLKDEFEDWLDKKKNEAELDFNSIQRGDPEMEQRVWRVIRACVELCELNPIVSVHDYGAGGNCNALPELVEPVGATFDLRTLPVGDKTLSVLEIWGNESQERMGFLIWEDEFEAIFKTICERENVPCTVVGTVRDDGMLVVIDGNSEPVQLPLKEILGDLPAKTFELKRLDRKLKPVEIPVDETIMDMLDLVLRHPDVADKGYLTTKVDRSVTGLVIQQQTIGPHQITLSDYAVTAQSYFEDRGMALSLGEQPIIGLISPKAGARMALAEAVLNMSGAKITKIEDIKLSGNWMWAAKEEGEGARLYDACEAASEMMIELGLAEDGGKDSLTMAVKAADRDGKVKTIKAPGEFVVGCYAPMPDVNKKVTADFKKANNYIVLVDLSDGKVRLGGSVLARCYKQLGDECPDVEDAGKLKAAFELVQSLVYNGLVKSIHDRSDGGLITTVLEMAFAGDMGLDIALQGNEESCAALFAEEPGFVLECSPSMREVICKAFDKIGISAQVLGITTRGRVNDRSVRIQYNSAVVLEEDMADLRSVWQETSFKIDALQSNTKSVSDEQFSMRNLAGEPAYALTFIPQDIDLSLTFKGDKPKVAIIREEGSNGDREMAAAFYLAGFDTVDVNMFDLLNDKVSLDDFLGVVFVGGFSYADVLDSAKGWAGTIRYNEKLQKQFDDFYQRTDTFSLGVCNGCQLMALLGWVPWRDIDPVSQPRFISNESERFQSRFSTVQIQQSPSLMFKGMEGTTMGVWVAHGQGRLYFPDKSIYNEVVENNLTPVVYVSHFGRATELFPYNPNGSVGGITALCSPDGRHLAMMPHPERAFMMRQWAWAPEEWKNLPASPWMKMFQNAYEWCMSNVK